MRSAKQEAEIHDGAPDPDARILLVEDDEDEIRLISRLLSQAPIAIEVNSFQNGKLALEHLETAAGGDDIPLPDLVLLDINMPVMDGILFLAKLRQHNDFKSLPVVVLTTSTDEELVRRAYDFGANAVINKVDSLDGMSQIANTIVDFWFRVARRYYVD
ncbi:Response regulator rcp1 [Hartmannibacter diazotrophicus]|uniref:Response regulator rcp1 n=1 Tax=Hartmannibacter diazotrophicus TaxID=1482074 RepID=A0A2C9DBB9_9HYPH|nr:response regulator [Hartmannibacter diazotrophicus]SON57632.1 Response regulator rcp1 [Hartmannibacter diazotrophicus]